MAPLFGNESIYVSALGQFCLASLVSCSHTPMRHLEQKGVGGAELNIPELLEVLAPLDVHG